MSFDTIKAYLDLTRLHFFIVWPMLFCSGLFLSFTIYGGFSWVLVLKAALIALFGFEAGFVLNDLVDAELDKRDIEIELTKYWRPFGSRPLAIGTISYERARLLFFGFFAVAALLIFSLPSPHFYDVLAIMVSCYGLEYFYQMRKRDQEYPIAQLIGRIDFSLFPVAGYLVNGSPDVTALLYFLFFYPFAQVHLGINDIIDVNNDKARGLKTIPILFGVENTKKWIHGFSLLHLLVSYYFMNRIGGIMPFAFVIASAMLAAVNYLIYKGGTPAEWLKALQIFHATLFVYMASLIANYLLFA